MANSDFLTFAGLQSYDTAIKNWANSAKQLGFKTVLKSSDGKNLYFYKKPNAILGTDAPDVTISLGSSADKKVWLTDNTSTAGTDYAKIYKLYQGENAPNAQTDPAVLIGTINIPKDMVVSSGTTVNIVFKASDNTLHEETEAGPDVTEAIVGAGGIATATDAGAYIKLVIANASNSAIYIKISSLVQVYSGGSTAEITVAIDANNVIKATINDIDGSKITYKAATAAVYAQVQGSDTFDENATYYTRSGVGTTEDPYIYTEDVTVDAENFDTKVTNGIYIRTAEATSRESVSAALARLDSANPISTEQINSLFE